MHSPEPNGLASVLRWLFTGANPEAVARKARLLILDTLGCVLAGLDAEPVRRLARGLADAEGGTLRLPRVDVALSPGSAGALLAVAACWDEACEGLARAHGRPGVPVIASCMALGARRNVSFEGLLDAVVAGYELGGRMGECLRIRPGMHVDAGWPALGVAAGVARLLGEPVERASAAVEIAASQLPFGLYLPVEQGSDARNTYLGHAAWLGTYAAFAAAAGIAAPGGALARHAELALGAPLPSPITPAGEFLILDAYLKPFAAVRHVHYGAQAALELRERTGADSRAIERLELTVYPEAQTYCGNRAPRTPIQAQFSLTFGVAAALRFGALGPEAYRAPMFEDEEMRRLEQLIAIHVDAELGAGGRRGARLQVDAGGRRFERTVTAVPGDPELPFTEAQCRAKFLHYTVSRLGKPRAEAIAEAILRGDGRTPVSALWERLVSS